MADLLASSMMEAVGNIDFMADLWKMVQAAGAFGAVIMFFLWKREADRADRLQAQLSEMNERHHGRKDELIERGHKALNDINLVLEGIKSILQGKGHL